MGDGELTGGRGRWLSEAREAETFLNPKKTARAVFHPAWVPQGIDPAVESLKKARIICGTVTAVGIYSFVQGGFAFDEMLENVLTASLVLLVVTPLTVGVMLFVWRRRTGHLRGMRTPLVNALVLLLIFIGSVALTVTTWQMVSGLGFLLAVLCFFAGLWLTVFVGAGAVYVSGNFFGTAAVHRCLPPLLAMVTTWLVAIPDLVTGDLHGLSLTLGIVFILGAPVTVTGIALLEMRRLRRHHGIRLGAHPATLPVPGSVPPPPSYPPSGNPYAGNPYAGNPYAGNPYIGNPSAAGQQSASYPPPAGNPYASGH